jgi:flagellar assembly protein FliH
MRSSFEPSPGVARAVFVPDGAAVPPGPEPASAGEPPQADDALAREYARGRDEARVELEAEAATRIGSAVTALEAAAEELARITAEERAALRAAVIELALALAGRLVTRELRGDCEALAPLVGDALALLPRSEGLRLALSPADAGRVQEGHAPALERLRSEWRAELVADAAVAAGEARVQGGAASVDVRVEAILERFREGLFESLPLPEDRPRQESVESDGAPSEDPS